MRSPTSIRCYESEHNDTDPDIGCNEPATAAFVATIGGVPNLIHSCNKHHTMHFEMLRDMLGEHPTDPLTITVTFYNRD